MSGHIAQVFSLSPSDGARGAAIQQSETLRYDKGIRPLNRQLRGCTAGGRYRHTAISGIASSERSDTVASFVRLTRADRARNFPTSTCAIEKAVFGTRRNKEEHRYYLLPGMGRSNRRRHAQFVRWAIVVGMIVSALTGLLLYIINRP